NTISIKTALYASLVIQLLLLVGFATVRFDWILIFSTLDAFFAGILSPRLQELIFKQIPVLRAFFYTNRRKGVKMIFK
ncbi:TPA: hypothetical protein ACJ0B6_002295, partial [Streptococcus pneumoniae]